MELDTVLAAVEQNHDRLKAITEELDLKHKMAADPESKANRAGFFVPDEKAKEAGLGDVEMSDEDRLAWMFEQNMKAIEALAKELGVEGRGVSSNRSIEANKYGGAFVPKSAKRRHEQKKQVRSEGRD